MFCFEWSISIYNHCKSYESCDRQRVSVYALRGPLVGSELNLILTQVDDGAAVSHGVAVSGTPSNTL